MSERVAVVTGGNKGIGFAVVKELCKKFNGVVYLTARDVTRGQNAVKELEKQGLKPKFHQLDVTNENSIQTFYEYLSKKYTGLDILINNAGTPFKVSAEEGFYCQALHTLDVNYFGIREVCKKLYLLLNRHARIVHVASSSGCLSLIPKEELRAKFKNPDLTEKQLDDLLDEYLEAAKQNKHIEEGWPSCAYIVSKVGVCALTEIQQRIFDSYRVINFGIAVNCIFPGYVETEMTNYKGILLPEISADAIVFSALLPPYTKITGKCIIYDKMHYVWSKNENINY